MDIQKLRQLNNGYVNSLLDQNKVDDALALEIIDLHLQPEPVIFAIYKKSLDEYKKTYNNNDKNAFLYSITEEMLEEGLYSTYPEPYRLVKDEINTTALSIKYSDLTADEFKEELKILEAKKDSDPFINNHHRYNYYAGLYAYQNKFGEFLDNNAFTSFYREEPTFDNIKGYLQDYLENYAINTYSSEEIKSLIATNEKESTTNVEFKSYHQERIDSDMRRLNDLKLSKKAIERVEQDDKYLEVEKIAYINALRMKQSIENDLDFIKKINNHTLNKVIEDLFKNKEMKASHLTMIKDIYSGDIDTVFDRSIKAEHSVYSRNCIKILDAINSDKNISSLDPDVNPFLIMKKDAIEKMSEEKLYDQHISILLNQYAIPSQYSHLLRSIDSLITKQIDKVSKNSLPNIIVDNMSEKDVYASLNKFDDYNTLKLRPFEDLTLDECKDVLKCYFSNKYQTDKISNKYFLLPESKKDLTSEELIKNEKMQSFFVEIALDKRAEEYHQNNMEVCLSTYINNNSEEKVKKLMEDIKSIKQEDPIIDKTMVLIDKLSLEKDSSLANNNIFSRLKRRFK